MLIAKPVETPMDPNAKLYHLRGAIGWNTGLSYYYSSKYLFYSQCGKSDT